jgi:hypothetical protein
MLLVPNPSYQQLALAAITTPLFTSLYTVLTAITAVTATTTATVTAVTSTSLNAKNQRAVQLCAAVHCLL